MYNYMHMNKEELLPYLNKFITVILEDGSEHTGYVTNPKEFIESEEEDPILILLNGMFTEEVHIAHIREILLPDRENTVSIPAVDLKDGYRNN